MILSCYGCGKQFQEGGKVIRVSQGKLACMGFDMQVIRQDDYCPQCFLDRECDAARNGELKD